MKDRRNALAERHSILLREEQARRAWDCARAGLRRMRMSRITRLSLMSMPRANGANAVVPLAGICYNVQHEKRHKRSIA